MGRQLLIDLDSIPDREPIYRGEALDPYLPQRHEMRQLDEVLHFNPEVRVIVGVKNVRSDEFWVRGHIPGRPLLPGVLIIEAAAQLCTVCHHLVAPEKTSRFIGMSAVEGVRFRASVRPGDRLVLVAHNCAVRSRASYFEVQGLVEGKLAFQGSITGVEV